MSEHKTVEQLNEIAANEYNKIKGKTLTNKDRMAIPQMEMPSGEPLVRARQMTEVALGYTAEQAIVEANRCLQCKVPQCQKGCPINTNIPMAIRLLKENKLNEAGKMLFENNPL